MYIDTRLDDIVAGNVAEYYRKREALHESSGKLSASILGWPLQWQVLKYLKVPQKPKDSYTLRKFLRGEHVEEYVASQMKGERQVQVEYKGCTGFIDVMEDIPHEIKSVSNMKYKRIMSDKQADPQHQLQAGLYALAMKSSEFVIDYVATDDYRITSFVYEVAPLKSIIDGIIDEYNDCIERKEVPVFMPRYKWQENDQYNSYPEFSTNDKDKMKALLKHYSITWK